MPRPKRRLQIYKKQSGEILFFVALTVGVISGVAALFGVGQDKAANAAAYEKTLRKYRDVALEATNGCAGFPHEELRERAKLGINHEVRYWWGNKLASLGCSAPMEISWLPDTVVVAGSDGGVTGIDSNPAGTSAIMQGLGAR